ncbi:hypothetical protein PtA15_18A309 [Puccinia triticina]|uniref:Uncharacterized protein n=1 Tax=Puccinia triticina TaxID=208348 RepID=A0ABY7DA69_9BASI|nr:uncharacterized protein PtA15_18A309 [Puccinia triticina]WAQ93251.1 hypothetical protein PtA15_18A309 [Puccinia triticina]
MFPRHPNHQNPPHLAVTTTPSPWLPPSAPALLVVRAHDFYAKPDQASALLGGPNPLPSLRQLDLLPRCLKLTPPGPGVMWSMQVGANLNKRMAWGLYVN